MSARNRRLVLSAQARTDLSDVLLYTERRWGRQRMRTYNRALTEAFVELQRFPYLGRPRPDLGPDFRSLPVLQHAVIYEVAESEITIIRLLHVRRDTESQFDTITEN